MRSEKSRVMGVTADWLPCMYADFFQIQAIGPDRAALLCSPEGCEAGTHRQYLSGGNASTATCRTCPAGTVDADNNPTTACATCSAGRYASGSKCVTCPLGRYGTANAVSAQACQLCRAGTSDEDKNPATPCTTCPAGRYSSSNGAEECTKCPGYPAAITRAGATRKSQCVYIIGYTSFEEPTIVGGTTVPKYVDSLGGDNNHKLIK